MAAGFIYHDAFLEHDTGPQHPERPARLLAVLDALRHSDLGDRLVRITPEPADLQWVLTAHSEQYVRRLQRACEDGVAYIDTPDCAICPRSFEAALLAAGAGIAAVDAVMAGQVQRAFCAIRPPGHHAEYDAAMGFCLLNNMAIAANYLRLRYGVNRVLILDWDVHHGNGTQHRFEEDPSVFVCSIHQDPQTLYPGTGLASEIGTGKGKGATLNLPMPAGSGDEQYCRELKEKFLPVAQSFSPEFVLVSAGFDAHTDDPLARMELSDDAFAWMSRMVCDLADQVCAGRLVSILEGGYNLEVLRRCVPEHLRIFEER